MYDLLITSDCIAADYGVFAGSVAVKDGCVAAIFRDGTPLPQAQSILDATGKIVLPGCIDSHVHIWEPGQTQRDDFEYGTRSLALGGVTTVLEHPLSVPAVKDAETFNLKLDIATEKSCIDFGLWGALLPTNFDKIEEMQQLGCVAFKGFISYANENYPHLADWALYKAMRKLKELGAITAVHAENADMAEEGGKEMRASGRKDPLAHLHGRETIVELEAIRRAIFFSRETGARLHIVHMSIHEGAEELKRAKAEGVPVTFETCPHYLVSDCSLLERRGPFGKCTPPLRRPENTEAMWRYIEDETIDFIASDSSCYAKEEKMLGIDDIWLAEPGLPGSATMVPMMADAFIHKRKLPMDLFARLLSANVAKVFGLYPQKGTILPGGDADFTILDPRRSWVVDGSKLYKCGWSPYDGEEVGVSVDSTIVRGEIVCQNGEFQLGKGYGRFVRPLR